LLLVVVDLLSVVLLVDLPLVLLLAMGVSRA
jgi:hypothetical protein